MDVHEKQLQRAAARVLTRVRLAGGVDFHEANALREALREAAAAWAASDTVTKSAANLFVDLANGIDACSSLYPGPEALEITLLADEIAALVRKCVTYAGVEPGLEDADG